MIFFIGFPPLHLEPVSRCLSLFYRENVRLSMVFLGIVARESMKIIFKSGDFENYRRKDVDRVVLRLSPGVRMAAAGFSFHSMLPPS